MQNKDFQIHIPKPCHADWDNQISGKVILKDTLTKHKIHTTELKMGGEVEIKWDSAKKVEK